MAGAHGGGLRAGVGLAAVAPQRPDPLEADIAAGQRALEEGLAAGGLRRNPYAVLVRAFGQAIGVLPRAVAALRQARGPISDERWAGMERRLEARAAKAFDKAAAGVQGQANRKTGLRLALAGAMAAAAVGIAGYALGRIETRSDVARVATGLSMELGAASAWEALIRANPDPRRALEAATLR